MLEGLPPNDAAWLCRLPCDEDTARAVADVVVEPPVGATALDDLSDKPGLIEAGAAAMP